jgi:hypothetical protein
LIEERVLSTSDIFVQANTIQTKERMFSPMLVP